MVLSPSVAGMATAQHLPEQPITWVTSREVDDEEEEEGKTIINKRLILVLGNCLQLKPQIRGKFGS